MTGGAPLVQSIVDSGLLDSGGGNNHYTALVVAALCAAGDYDAHLGTLKASYRRAATRWWPLREQVPGASVRAPGAASLSGLTCQKIRPAAPYCLTPRPPAFRLSLAPLFMWTGRAERPAPGLESLSAGRAGRGGAPVGPGRAGLRSRPTPQ